ncbi:MAG: hypothetical protein MJY62_05115 [Bacteroidales bacterium]|nr:hypothetical protein [Bacteroidales bacterium]
MKKFFIFASVAVLALSLVSCNKEPQKEPEKPQDYTAQIKAANDSYKAVATLIVAVADLDYASAQSPILTEADTTGWHFGLASNGNVDITFNENGAIQIYLNEDNVACGFEYAGKKYDLLEDASLPQVREKDGKWQLSFDKKNWIDAGTAATDPIPAIRILGAVKVEKAIELVLSAQSSLVVPTVLPVRPVKEGFFDDCDFIREGWTIGHAKTNTRFCTIDDIAMAEGIGCYSFNLHLPFTKLDDQGQEVPAYGNTSDYLGQFPITRPEDAPLMLPANASKANTVLHLQVYTSAPSILENVLHVDLGNTKSNDANAIKVNFGVTWKEGWNEFAIPLSAFGEDYDFDITKGIVSFRVLCSNMNGNTGEVASFTMKFDDIYFEVKNVTTVTVKDGEGNDCFFRNTHSCFSPDGKIAYIPTQNGSLVALDPSAGAPKWVWTTPEAKTNNCVNVACNPVTGDVYLHNKGLTTDGFYAIAPNGTTKWHNTDIFTLGSCFAVSSDGNVVFACGTSKTIPNANNRELGAFKAADGTQLDRCYQRGDALGGEGIVNPFMYCNNAQMAVYKTDATYDYIVIWANELLQFYTYNRSTNKFKGVNMSKPYDTWKSWGDACSIGLAVGPDNKIYLPSNAKGVIMIIDGAAAEPWNNVSWFNCNLNLTGIVFDAAGDMIIGTRQGAIKVAKAKIAGGTKEAPVDPATVATYVASIGKDVFTHAHPYVTATGDVYTACNNADVTLCGDIYMIPSTATGACAPTEVYHDATSTSAQGMFCLTNGYAIEPNTEPKYITVLGVKDLATPKTWCGYGGDLCASMNVKFAYGK